MPSMPPSSAFSGDFLSCSSYLQGFFPSQKRFVIFPRSSPCVALAEWPPCLDEEAHALKVLLAELQRKIIMPLMHSNPFVQKGSLLKVKVKVHIIVFNEY